MIATFWASIALLVPVILAESTSTTSTAAATPSCTSSLITRLCSYPEPGPEFAVASESRSSCWAYCEAHSPCDFVIFSAGNPTTGTGTCWLYPGKSFDKGQGTSDCANPSLYVYSKPDCTGGTPTTTSGSCAATETPSAIASVCGYPTPPGDCFDGCTASLGASDCLSQCARADSCTYVVFNPRNPSGSPYASGTCWMYPKGAFRAGDASECSGDPEQFVYDNKCPKPSLSSTSSASSSSSSSSSSSLSSSATDGLSGTGVVADAAVSTPTGENSASGLSLTGMNTLGMGVAVSIWRAIQ